MNLSRKTKVRCAGCGKRELRSPSRIRGKRSFCTNCWRNHRTNIPDVSVLIAEYNSGLTLNEIGLKYGTTPSTIGNKLGAAGVARRGANEVERKKRIPKCHPDRPHKCKGMCHSCYDKYIYRLNPSKHTSRHAKWAARNRLHVSRYAKDRKLKQRQVDPISYVLSSIRGRARKYKIEFSITYEDLKAVWTDVCPVFGTPLKFNLGFRKDNSYTVDRMNNSLGYLKGNIRIISWRANRIKLDATLEELECLVRYMRTASEPSAPAPVIAPVKEDWEN